MSSSDSIYCQRCRYTLKCQCFCYRYGEAGIAGAVLGIGNAEMFEFSISKYWLKEITSFHYRLIYRHYAS